MYKYGHLKRGWLVAVLQVNARIKKFIEYNILYFATEVILWKSFLFGTSDHKDSYIYLGKELNIEACS